MDCSLPDFSVHDILQARVPEWVAIPSSSGSSQLRGQICISYVSCIGRRVLYYWCHLGNPHGCLLNNLLLSFYFLLLEFAIFKFDVHLSYSIFYQIVLLSTVYFQLFHVKLCSVRSAVLKVVQEDFETLSRRSRGQNYFNNNTNTLFPFFTHNSNECTVEFPRSYMKCVILTDWGIPWWPSG